MTFRARPAPKPAARRRRQEHSSRRNLYLNLAFGGTVIVALLILAAAAGASWYGDHFGAVGSVDGTTITRDQYRDRYKVEQFRFDAAAGRIRDEFNAGRMTQSEEEQRLAIIDQQRSTLSDVALERLIDANIQGRLATEQGISVSDQDISDALTKEATRPEERHVWMISVEPKVDTGKNDPTDAQKAAAKAIADKALADIKGGKSFEDVAKAVSGDPSSSSGGDLGWFNATDGSLETNFSKAVFAAPKDTPTDVVVGTDNVYRIGRVSEIAPASVDQAWNQKITDFGISMDVYRTAVRADVVQNKLQDKIVADVVDTATAQRRVSEIKIAAGQGTGDEVKVRHILYAPNNITDPQQLGQLPSNDPAWITAKNEAQAAYDKLKAYSGAELETQFKALADKESDDPSGKGTGGELPYLTADQLDTGFANAIFKNGLKKDDLIGPVQSQYGWHVVLFEDRRPPAQARAENAALEASKANADFAALARQLSDGPEASKGGDLGWVARYQLDQQLEDVIFKTPVGSVSALTEVPGDGWYLFKVWEEQTRKPEGDQADTLRSQAFSNWYQREKAKANITRDLPTSTGATS